MRVSTSKSKNAESFYITKSYINNKGKSTSKIIRKLGTLEELSVKLGTDRDGVMEWAKEQADIETLRYKEDEQSRTVLIPFHSDRQLDYGKQIFYKGGYLFLQSVYYGLKLDRVCRKIRSRHKFEYDINAILSDLFIQGHWNLPAYVPLFRQPASTWSPLLMHSMTFTVRCPSWPGNVTLYSLKYIKTAFSLEKEVTVSSTMTVQTIISKSNRKTGIKNTAKARNTAQIRSSRWVCL